MKSETTGRTKRTAPCSIGGSEGNNKMQACSVALWIETSILRLINGLKSKSRVVRW